MATHEHTINVALGEVLAELRPHSWRIHAEETRTLQHAAKQPDILIEEASQSPIRSVRPKHRIGKRDQNDHSSSMSLGIRTVSQGQ